MYTEEVPSKNTQRVYATDAFYHVYNRGVAKQPIFLDAQDKYYFMGLMARHLDPEDDSVRSDGRTYEAYDIELVSYCLMKNHFHLLLYQMEDIEGVSKFLRSISTAYAMYFNKKYKRVGPIFQGKYKASAITNDSYFLHISRYIHLNPRTYKTYKWSSLPEFIGTRDTVWVHPERVLDMQPEEYMAFLEDYEDKKAILEELKKLL